MKSALNIILIIILTVLTQIGGLVYLFVWLVAIRYKLKSRGQIAVMFLLLYALITFLFVPYLAPLAGREKVRDTQVVRAHSFVYHVLNRNYVVPEINILLDSVSIAFADRHPEIQIVHLDAGFPFFDGFPLLPHLSHNDGKKIDFTFIYESSSGIINNKKKSRSGYGVYVEPAEGEVNQNELCKSGGETINMISPDLCILVNQMLIRFFLRSQLET